jgi:AcrR family transcriptional regulator
MKPDSAKTTKGEQTRALIIDKALELFRERGYEQTTMRAIAERSGLALSNAYYYFHSKAQLILAFYDRTLDEHRAAVVSTLERERDLKTRLLEVVRAKISTIEPFHEFAGALFKTAADPRSPLNPFSRESDPVRQESIAMFAAVIDGSNVRVPNDLKAELPYLLWLYHMGLVLFWIHDSSRDRARTHLLVDRTVELVVRLIKLASHPLMRPVRKAALGLVTELKRIGTQEEDPGFGA